MEQTKAKLTSWKGYQKYYVLWEIKFLPYSHISDFVEVLEKGANLPKKEKVVTDPSVMDQKMLLIRKKMK